MTLEKVERAVERAANRTDALPEPGGLGWTRKHRRQAKRLGLPDPSSPRLKLHKAMETPQYPHLASQWHRDGWKRAQARWKRKWKIPSIIILNGVGWGVADVMHPIMFNQPFHWSIWDTGVVGGTAIGAGAWKVAADKVNEQKRRRLARMKRRLKRARREEMGDSTPPIRERMAEPPFYTDSPAVVRDNQFKRRNRNQL